MDDHISAAVGRVGQMLTDKVVEEASDNSSLLALGVLNMFDGCFCFHSATFGKRHGQMEEGK